MKKNLYRHAALSLVLITIWMMYVTFNHLIGLDDNSSFLLFGLWIDFFYSCMAGAGLGILMLLARLLYFRKTKNGVLPGTFIYLLACIFNVYLIVVWIICLATGLLDLGTDFTTGTMAVIFLSALFILTDIYRAKFRTNAIVVSGND